MEKPPWPWQQENSTPTTDLLDLTAKQTLDTLLAIQMRLELATGVPVAIFGPTGQHLPSISPALARSAEHHVPLPRAVLAADQWPQRNGQLLAVTWGKHLHFFITPVVINDQTIAQVVLGPLQVFDSGKQDELASKHTPPRAKAVVGVPVLASWKAHAVAEIATIIVSLYSNQRSMEGEQKRQALFKAPAAEAAPLPLPAMSQTGHHTQLVQRPEESTAYLAPLAESARLPEPADTRPSTSGQIEPLTTAQERVRLLGALLETMPQAVVICSAPDGQIILANRAARALWPDLLGESGSGPASASKRIYLEDYPLAWAPLRQALCQGITLSQGEISLEPPTQQAAASSSRPHGLSPLTNSSPQSRQRRTLAEDSQAISTPDAQALPTRTAPARLALLVNAFPLRNAHGAVTHAVATFEEVSSLLERESFKDDLVLRAAHDARNPLTIIASAAQLLEHTLGQPGTAGSARERERRWLADIQTQTQHLTELTKHLTLLVRLQDARHPPRRETFNLVRLVEQAIGDQQSLTPERRIETSVEPDLCLVEGSALQVEHIFKHVLSNAAKYSRPDTPISVILRGIPEHAPLWAEISVRDQGIGIPRTCLPHLFERWYQVPQTPERQALAAQVQPPRTEISQGMSLYLCKQLLEQLGGQIWAESTEGQGTVVKLLLPLKKC